MKWVSLPDENVAASLVVINSVCHALAVITVTRHVDGQAEVSGDGQHSVVGSPP